MGELAIVPRSSPTLSELPQCPEAIAEHNFNKKRLLSLEQSMALLHKAARQQHEVMSQLEQGMKSMISDGDLRRAIGLTFQEFEQRLEDAFQDSGRKCLAMFSKREEVAEIQGHLNKKVNWTEYNTVLKKLADLRQYVDTMAESIFIGHRDALNSEFAKKADASMVEQALKSKADLGDVSEVQARLERLEVLVSHEVTRHAAKLEALREEAAERNKAHAEKQQVMMAENAASITALREQQAANIKRLGGVEGEVRAASTALEKLCEAQRRLQESHERVVQPTMAALRDQQASLDAALGRLRSELQTAAGEAKEFRDASAHHVGELSTQAGTFKSQLEFLLEATEMIKRKARESAKANTSKFKDVADEQEKLSQQLAAIERQLKRQEREVRAIENRAAKDQTFALRPLPPIEPAVADPNERLKHVLDQLEKIAGGGLSQEQLGVEWNPQRPPLPFGSETMKRAPIDSARGVATVHAMYGLSPRTPAKGMQTARQR